MESIQKAKLPSLQKLLLYIGVEDYGFDGDLATIQKLLAESDFPNLAYLGLTDSEIQDEITEAVFDSKYIDRITTLDLSMGSLTDKGGQILLDKIPEYPNIKQLELEYHYMSDEMMEKLEALPGVQVNVEDQQEADDYDGELYFYPMLTEEARFKNECRKTGKQAGGLNRRPVFQTVSFFSESGGQFGYRVSGGGLGRNI